MQTKSYGTWDSPIHAELLVRDAVGFGTIKLDANEIYWTETRPGEGGRTVLVRAENDGTLTDLTPPPYNVRTRVHEYGGGAFTVHEGRAFFVNDADQRLYSLAGDGSPPRLLTTEDLRFADIQWSDYGLVAVGEKSRTGLEPQNLLVLIDPDAGDCRVLAEGHDFFASPTVCPLNNQIAWLTWDHPNMPWDGTDLWRGELTATGIKAVRHVAGGNEESIFQPQWSPDGKLYFVSDRTNWWNLYRQTDSGDCLNVYPRDAEFGLPQWVFQMSTWAFVDKDTIFCKYHEKGSDHLLLLNAAEGRATKLELPYSSYSQIRACGRLGVCIAGAEQQADVLIKIHWADLRVQVLRQSLKLDLDTAFLSNAEPLDYLSARGRLAHAYYYSPKNPEFVAPSGERPPLIVKSHGGPTAATSTALNLKIQYWTSRGFAVLDVNYGGSTGYGRIYRQLLRNNWGIVDVEDCVAGARYLVDQGLADAKRLAITGGSAGGYTTLAALTFHDLFTAGASYYGVSDLSALARDTHKFESHYLDGLVGPFPEDKDRYDERSPIFHADTLSCPVIFFQGMEDKIVPPEQALGMVRVLQEKGIDVEYIPYEGEQHGFRQAAHIIDALEKELAFYRRVWTLA